MTQISRDAPARSATVIDSPKVLKCFAWVIGLLLAAVWFLFSESISDKTPNETNLLASIFGLCILAMPSIIAFIYFIVNKKGYVIDVENDIFEFPGGGIEADSWTTYFTLTYWLQGFKRHQIPLSAIREIQVYHKEKNQLDISGDFGAISFNFSSKGKCDQLYSAIISLNKMGDPMLRR